MKNDLFINILGFIGVTLNFSWPLFRKRHLLLLVQAIACVFFILHFYLIGAFTGATMTLIMGAQALIAIPLENKKLFRYIFLLTIPIALFTTYLTWNGLPSAFTAVAIIVLSIGRYQLDVQKIRLYIMISIFFWVGHNLLVYSVPGLFSDTLTLSSCAWMYLKEKKRREFLSK